VVTQRKALAFSREQVAAQAGATRDTQRPQARLRELASAVGNRAFAREVARRRHLARFPLLNIQGAGLQVAALNRGKTAVPFAAGGGPGGAGQPVAAGAGGQPAPAQLAAAAPPPAPVFGRDAPPAGAQGAVGPPAAGYRLRQPPAQLPIAASKSEAVLRAGGRMGSFATWLRTQYPPLGKQHNDAADPNLLERFILRVDEVYAPPGTPPQRLRIYFQFDGPFFGYIVGITERPDAQGQAAALQDKGSMTTALQPPAGLSQYSNVHDPGNYNIGQRVDTTPARQSWDAIAKVAAEGSRWQCVAQAVRQGLLTNDLVFFTVVQPQLNLTLAPQPQVPIRVGIKFEDLWRYWTAFDNAYNIPNQTVATQLSTWYAAYLDWDWAQTNQEPDPGHAPSRRHQDYPLWQARDRRFRMCRNLRQQPMPHPRLLPPPAQAQAAAPAAPQVAAPAAPQVAAPAAPQVAAPAAPQAAARTALVIGAAAQGLQV
jgi:hypothetical protein